MICPNLFLPLFLALLLCVAPAASAYEAAPYTRDANERLNRVQKKMDAPDLGSQERQKNVAVYVEYLNKLYSRADYDFSKSLAEYYQDIAETNGVPGERIEAQFTAKVAIKLDALMAGMSVENAFPGKEYEAVRVAYKSLRAAGQGIKLPPDQIAAIKQRRADVEARKSEKLQAEKNAKLRADIGMFVVIAIITSLLVGFLLWPVSMFLRRKKLAEKERAAPYVYIKKHANYPEPAEKALRNPEQQ